MIRILLSATNLTPDIIIKNSALESVDSGEMTEIGPSNDGRFWYGYSFTGTAGSDYFIEIDAGVAITTPELRFFSMWITEESTAGGLTPEQATQLANTVKTGDTLLNLGDIILPL